MGSRSRFWNVTWALVQGDKAWHGNQWPALSSRNLYFFIHLANIFQCKDFFFLVELCWNRGCLLFKKKKSSLKFAHFSWQSPRWLSRWKIKKSRFQRRCLCVSNQSHGGTFMHNCSFCGNLVELGGRMWAQVHYSSDSLSLRHHLGSH